MKTTDTGAPMANQTLNGYSNTVGARKTPLFIKELSIFQKL